MFQKILIANRGEIAVRIAKTAKRLGIHTVAVYSETDKNSLHVDVCDEAVCIGGQSPVESYLIGEEILKAAQQTKSDAIHPGYGFLSENAEFAELVEKSKICFVGPTAETIRKMGSKSQAKDLMVTSHVPVMPGYQGADQTTDRFINEANRIGYPVLLKATAGGGGKGMRVVEKEEQLEDELEAAKREAQSAFGDDRFLVERYLPQARHLEVQIFGDGQGNIVHLFERDCSIQRRYQKIIEEAPAPKLSSAVRTKLLEAGINAGKSVNYRGAGTVEFLYDGDVGIYFMEMNTRLQVEHPVTEAITGIDLVEWQFRVASGEGLPKTQEQITENGHAFEARVYAENPENKFSPSVGMLSSLELPVEYARIDSGVKEGDVISPYYDPMIAKIITHDTNREKALNKLEIALTNTRVADIHTNTKFLNKLICDHKFRAGFVSTGYIEEHGERLLSCLPATMYIFAAALVSFRERKINDLRDPLWRALSGFRINQTSEELYWAVYQGRTVLTRFLKIGKKYRISIENNAVASERGDDDETETNQQSFIEIEIIKIDQQEIIFNVDESRQKFHVSPLSGSTNTLRVWLGADYWDITFPNMVSGNQNDLDNTGSLKSNMPGIVTVLLADIGQHLERGDPILVLEAMKMEHTITAPKSGIVKSFRFKPGDQVKENELLLDFEES